MNNKKTFLAIAIAIFMVFSLSVTTSESFAYWASSVNGANNITQTATVTIGTWSQAYPWSSTESYLTGDLVTHNGTTYQAKKDYPTKEPGVQNGWTSEWTVV